jgi:large subunit ribosomal protein L29
MAEMKEIRKKSDQDLMADLRELKHEQMNLRFQQVNKQLTSTARFAVIRRNVARIKTELNERKRKGAR